LFSEYMPLLPFDVPVVESISFSTDMSCLLDLHFFRV